MSVEEPYDRRFEGGRQDRVERSKEAADYIRGGIKPWDEAYENLRELHAIRTLADLNTHVATTLAPLGADATARLFYKQM